MVSASLDGRLVLWNQGAGTFCGEVLAVGGLDRTSGCGTPAYAPETAGQQLSILSVHQQKLCFASAVMVLCLVYHCYASSINVSRDIVP